MKEYDVNYYSVLSTIYSNYTAIVMYPEIKDKCFINRDKIIYTYSDWMNEDSCGKIIDKLLKEKCIIDTGGNLFITKLGIRKANIIQKSIIKENKINSLNERIMELTVESLEDKKKLLNTDVKRTLITTVIGLIVGAAISAYMSR